MNSPRPPLAIGGTMVWLGSDSITVQGRGETVGGGPCCPHPLLTTVGGASLEWSYIWCQSPRPRNRNCTGLGTRDFRPKACPGLTPFSSPTRASQRRLCPGPHLPRLAHGCCRLRACTAVVTALAWDAYGSHVSPIRDCREGRAEQNGLAETEGQGSALTLWACPKPRCGSPSCPPCSSMAPSRGTTAEPSTA